MIVHAFIFAEAPEILFLVVSGQFFRSFLPYIIRLQFSEIVYFPKPDTKIKIPEKIIGELDFVYWNSSADQQKTKESE
jgi:hypothetical protein